MHSDWIEILRNSFDATGILVLGGGLFVLGLMFFLLPQAGDLQFNFRLQEHILRSQKAYRAADNVRKTRKRTEKRLPLYGKSMMIVGFLLFLIGLSWSCIDTFK